MQELQAFEKVIDFQFKNEKLLQQALTHRSFLNEYKGEAWHDNERMEFLGDAILDFIVADMLYKRFPDMAEGELTRLRAALVRTKSLAALAQQCQLGDYLIMGKGEEQSGGRTRRNNLCRGFESLIGAMYLDQGMESVKSFVLPRLDELLKIILEQSLHRDARSDLQEWSQSELSITPKYRVIGSAGPDHKKEFMIEVVIDGTVIGRGVGNSKRAAAQSAARSALERLEAQGWPE